MRGTSAIRLTLYLVYALLLCGVLLWVRFPSEKFEKFLVYILETTFDGIAVDLGKFSYRFPVGVHLDRVEFSDSTIGGEQVILLEDIDISADMAGMGLHYAIAGDLYGGRMGATLKISPVAQRFSLEPLELSGVEVNRSTSIKRAARRDITGVLSFSGLYSGSYDRSETTDSSKFEGILQLQSGEFSLRQPILTLRKMDVQTLKVGLNYDNGILSLNDGALDGADLHANFSGTVAGEGRFESWQTDIDGELVAQQGLLQDNPQVTRVVKRLQKQYRKTALPFQLRGSVANPTFRFGGK